MADKGGIDNDTTAQTTAAETTDEVQGLDDDTPETITLISGGDDKQKFELTLKQAKLAQLIQTMITGDKTAKEFPCPQVPAETLKNIVEYLKHHDGVQPEALPCPVRSIHMNQICSDEWDAKFIDNFEKKAIFEIILAANYLDITSLLHLGCAKIATLIKQLDQKEINRIIDEEEKYRRQHANDQAQANENAEDDTKADA